MTFTFPQNAEEFLIMSVPLLTLVLGLAFLIIPGRVLYLAGLEPLPGKPEAIGEGRSSFAGGMITVALGCLLLQEPIALQPGLNLLLSTALSIAALGRVLQMGFDGGLRRKRVQVRFIFTLGLAVLAWSVTEIPYLSCQNPFGVTCQLPSGLKEWFLFAIAVLTLGLGLIALLFPDRALKILRLQTRINTPFARGETRAMLAGFYVAIGGVYLLMPQPVDFVALVLGAAWLLTGLGRVVSIVFDRGLTLYNTVGAIFEIVIGLLVLAFVLRLIAL